MHYLVSTAVNRQLYILRQEFNTNVFNYTLYKTAHVIKNILYTCYTIYLYCIL